MENPIKMDDLGVPLFLETPILVKYYVLPSWQLTYPTKQENRKVIDSKIACSGHMLVPRGGFFALENEWLEDDPFRIPFEAKSLFSIRVRIIIYQT